jgi:DNA-binding IclR family transcriptional regulator
MADGQPSYSTMRTMQTLEILAREPLRTAQVADLIQAHVRTTRRILHRLAKDGYLSKGPSWADPWTPTEQLQELGARLATRAPSSGHTT